MIEGDSDPAVELYFRQCALQVDCRDLALMAATLASGGVQPRTGERVFEAEIVERVLSVMTTCGMYDAAGEWVADVGLPAKSGVGGGVLAVLPGQMGIALYSPRLDDHGNSVRGVAACRQISRELELHFLHVASERRSAIRASWDVGGAPSSRRRTPDEQDLLNEYGPCARVYALHGDLLFAGAEAVLREFTQRADDLEVIVLDISRVSEIAEVARRMLAASQAALAERGCALALVDPDGELDSAESLAVFADPDEATAWAEDRLIERHGGEVATTDPIPLAEHGLAIDLRPEELSALRPLLERRSVQAGERIVSEGQEPAGIFFVVSGQASADVTDPDGTVRRVAVLPAGTSFGKRAVISGEPHATDVDADTELELFVLTPDAMRELERRAPRTAIALLRIMFAQSRATTERGPAEDVHGLGDRDPLRPGGRLEGLRPGLDRERQRRPGAEALGRQGRPPGDAQLVDGSALDLAPLLQVDVDVGRERAVRDLADHRHRGAVDLDRVAEVRPERHQLPPCRRLSCDRARAAAARLPFRS